jgi:hypothetical protein
MLSAASSARQEEALRFFYPVWEATAPKEFRQIWARQRPALDTAMLIDAGSMTRQIRKSSWKRLRSGEYVGEAEMYCSCII